MKLKILYQISKRDYVLAIWDLLKNTRNECNFAIYRTPFLLFYFSFPFIYSRNNYVEDDKCIVIFNIDKKFNITTIVYYQNLWSRYVSEQIYSRVLSIFIKISLNLFSEARSHKQVKINYLICKSSWESS